MTPTAHGIRDESGAVMVIFAMLLASLVIIMALVLDLGMLRSDRKTNKNTADHATAAGLLALEDISAADGRPHPWRGVCAAYNYVKANGSELSSLGAEQWTDQDDPPVLLVDPCADPIRLAAACNPGDFTTYARFYGEADGGRITVEIKSGYKMPDADFTDDSRRPGDNGDPAEEGCDNVAVIISESQPRGFSAVMGDDDFTTTVRSVGRVTVGTGLDAPVSLLLLERHECRALRVEGENSRVIVDHSDDDGDGPGTDGMWPGLIHSDSDGSICSDGQYVLEGGTAGANPSILAKSATLAHPDTGVVLPSHIGIYALFFPGRPAHTPYPSTIGDRAPEAAQRQGRSRIDDKYLANIRDDFDAEANSVVGLNTPPAGEQWTIYDSCQIDGALPTPTTVGLPNKHWFRCNDLWIKTGALTLTEPDTEIVITGALQVDAFFEVHDLRKLWLRGRATGNKVGLAVTGNTATLRLNTGGVSPCAVDATGATPAGKTASVYVRDGEFIVGSNATFRACSTFVLLKGSTPLPSTSGTLPTNSTDNRGTFTTTSGGVVTEWTAPNELNTAQPDDTFLDAHPFEDLALWTEASRPSILTGGGASSVEGVFFLPNANDFTVSGGGAPEMPAHAQFISRKIKVTGGGLLKMTPDAFNFVLIPSFEGFDLVR